MDTYRHYIVKVKFSCEQELKLIFFSSILRRRLSLTQMVHSLSGRIKVGVIVFSLQAIPQFANTKLRLIRNIYQLQCKLINVLVLHA